MARYSLTCKCGLQIEVSAGAAGHLVACQACQRSPHVPRFSALLSTARCVDGAPFREQRNPWFTVVFPVFVLLSVLILPFCFVAGFAGRLDGGYVIDLVFLKEPRALYFVLGTLVFAGLWYWGERRVARPETFVSRFTRFLLTLLGSLLLAALAYVIIFIYLVLLLQVELLPRMG